MSPKRPGGQAFRAVGGDVVSRGGRALPDFGLSLLRYLGREAMRCVDVGDTTAARCCALMAADLAAAIAAAEHSRQAAGG